MDEPFNGLDKHMVEKMRQVLNKQKQEGKTILLASHNEKDIAISVTVPMRLTEEELYLDSNRDTEIF